MTAFFRPIFKKVLDYHCQGERSTGCTTEIRPSTSLVNLAVGATGSPAQARKKM